MDRNDLSNSLAIGLEIGGTKLQAGIGTARRKLLKPPIRRRVIPENGAEGIRRDLISMVGDVLANAGHRLADIDRIGIGFGGVLDANQGLILKSYQVDGWDQFPLKKWAEEQWGKPVLIQNDASSAGLAEALHGAGRGYHRIFYMTIGSGIGGGWIVDGVIDNGQGIGAAEIGHTWIPDPLTGLPIELEQFCSGWAIGRRARRAIGKGDSIMTDMAGSLEGIDAKVVYAAAEKGDAAANQILRETCRGLGLAISNVIALLHPERVILGGGVSLMGSLFWDTVRSEVASRAMPSLVSSVDIVRAELADEVVVIGALCL